MINSFRGKYGYLSNYHEVYVTYNGITYNNAEAAFHAQKDLTQSERFAKLNPSEAKRLGRQVSLRSNWEQVKDQIMYEVCLAKFTQNNDLKKKLLETGQEKIVEGTTGWHDNYWGNCECERCKHIKGKNRLGKILMRIRSELADIG